MSAPALSRQVGPDATLRDDTMAWATPQFSKADVDRAGAALIDEKLNDTLTEDPGFQRRETWDAWEVYDEALRVTNNWRSSHSYPLNVFQINLRRKVRRVDTQGLVSQRIKRLPAIDLKLRLHHHMKLSQMQDIGGCRAVVRSVRGVYRLLRNYHAGTLHHHDLRRTTDYIKQPRKSGYRSVHLIYRYGSKDGSPYDGHLIEIQIRSLLQHAWAGAVETVG